MTRARAKSGGSLASPSWPQGLAHDDAIGELPDRERAAEDYEHILPEAFDCVPAELGGDGHIAALYPNSPAMAEPERLVLLIQAPTRPVQRITVTSPVFERTLEVLVVATGRDRAEWVARALAPTGNALAISGRLPREKTWFLDRKAAASLDAHA